MAVLGWAQGWLQAVPVPDPPHLPPGEEMNPQHSCKCTQFAHLSMEDIIRSEYVQTEPY